MSFLKVVLIYNLLKVSHMKCQTITFSMPLYKQTYEPTT